MYGTIGHLNKEPQKKNLALKNLEGFFETYLGLQKDYTNVSIKDKKVGKVIE